MGFLGTTSRPKSGSKQGVSLELLHKMECRACPLNKAELQNGKMDPAGSDAPVVYMLGDNPSRMDDRRGEHFTSDIGQVLHIRIPEKWESRLRWNNVIRSHPGNRGPEFVEIECCRPAVAGDIARTKPKAVFGFGTVPLNWAGAGGRIMDWNGRRFPVNIGGHKTWFYPMYHPQQVLNSRRRGVNVPNRRMVETYGSDIEHVFALDLKRAFSEIDNLPEPVVHTAEDARRGVTWVTGAKGETDMKKVLDMLEHFSSQRVVGVDYETSALRPYRKIAKVLTVGLSDGERSFAFPLEHPKAGWTENQRSQLRKVWRRFLLKSKCRKVVHNLTFEMEWTGVKFGPDLLRAGKWGDTQSQAFVLDERAPKMKQGPLSLNFLCLQYFGLHLKAISPDVDRKNMESVPLESVLPYNAIDAKYHKLLFVAQNARLKSEGLVKVYLEALRRVPTMVLTQMKGMPVDQKMVEHFSDLYGSQLEKAEKAIADLPEVVKWQKRTGKRFEPSNNHQISDILRTVLKVKPDRDGKISCDEKALSGLKGTKFGKLILDWRKPDKLKSVYVNPMKIGSPILWDDGMLHPILNTTVASTGRLSSEDPNSQNYPKRKNKEVRRQIRKRKHLVVSFDYGQIEFRVIAMASKAPALVKILWERYDVHRDWMEKIAYAYPKWVGGDVKKFLGEPADVKKFRDKAKNEWVFPNCFGARAASLAGYLGIPEDIAVRLQEEFFAEFPGLKEWQDGLRQNFKRTGYVECLTGRRRRAPISDNQLINAPVQGTAADIVIDAMNRLSELRTPKRGEDVSQWLTQPNINVHDDLTFILPEDEVDDAAEIIIDTMVGVPFEFVNVPISIEMSMGPSWADQEEVGTFASDTWKK